MFELVSNTPDGAHNILGGGVTRSSVQDVAHQMGADFETEYVPCGYIGDDGQFVEPLYTTGVHVGQSRDRYILRADTKTVLGVHSGKYPERDAYSHVFDTLEQLWPKSCEGITVFGDGERVVVTQVLDEPIDLGGGDEIQPYLYTRMSLNGLWKTETIPVHRRLSCENMLGYVGQIIGVRATKNHDRLLTLRSSTLDKAMAQQATLVQMARVFKDQTFTDAQFHAMVTDLLPAPDEDAHERTKNAWTAKRAAIYTNWRSECDDWGQSMWTAYNAAQGAEQHRISKNYKSTAAANNRSLTKALNGATPIADGAADYLRSLVVAAA